ncbi:MAG: hypothetical protein Q8O67_04520 [Deltaproteobacteria bacterium]|nr:hypothetical protein [Deltaproteobacteria bacterium]
MRKWRLMLTTLPIVAAVLGVKLLLRYLGFEGAIEFGDVGVVLTGAVFLTGFMLAGVMTDYKESEKLPGELACALENLEETLVAGARSKQLDVAEMRLAIVGLIETVKRWLTNHEADSTLYAAISAFSIQLEKLEAAGASSSAGRAQYELWTVRRHLTRMDVIHKTTFLQTGYALLDTLVGLSILIVIATKFKTQLAEVIVVPVVTLIFVYMLRLIRDADDPFDYDSAGRAGAADVDLFPLTDYEARLRSRLKDDVQRVGSVGGVVGVGVGGLRA